MVDDEPESLLRAVWAEGAETPLEQWERVPLLDAMRVPDERRATVVDLCVRALQATLDAYIDGYDEDMSSAIYIFATQLSSDLPHLEHEINQIDLSSSLLETRINCTHRSRGAQQAVELLLSALDTPNVKPPSSLSYLVAPLLTEISASQQERLFDLVCRVGFRGSDLEALATCENPEIRRKLALMYQVAGIGDSSRGTVFSVSLHELSRSLWNCKSEFGFGLFDCRLRVPVSAEEFVDGLAHFVTEGGVLAVLLNRSLSAAITQAMARPLSRSLSTRLHLVAGAVFAQNETTSLATEHLQMSMRGSRIPEWIDLRERLRPLRTFENIFEKLVNSEPAPTGPRLFRVPRRARLDWVVFDADVSRVMTWDDRDEIAELLNLLDPSDRQLRSAIKQLPPADLAIGTYTPSKRSWSRDTSHCVVIKPPDDRQGYFELTYGGPGEESSGECEGDSAAAIAAEILTINEERDPEVSWSLKVREYPE